MPRRSAGSASASASVKPKPFDRRRKAFHIQPVNPMGRVDLIPQGTTAVPVRPETAEALAHMHQYDDSEDGIGVIP